MSQVVNLIPESFGPETRDTVMSLCLCLLFNPFNLLNILLLAFDFFFGFSSYALERNLLLSS